jgi:hypothetical protein
MELIKLKWNVFFIIIRKWFPTETDILSTKISCLVITKVQHLDNNNSIRYFSLGDQTDSQPYHFRNFPVIFTCSKNKYNELCDENNSISLEAREFYVLGRLVSYQAWILRRTSQKNSTETASFVTWTVSWRVNDHKLTSTFHVRY